MIVIGREQTAGTPSVFFFFYYFNDLMKIFNAARRTQRNRTAGTRDCEE